ncbi:MAG: type II toxin-antitoxin system RelE/ParE family toxin [Candidatus Gastranaerophilaceae bacterium]|nr:type II toxin-antitoxin system RelE/ParE family toxin [Candidatus Gastranaerophilaceae bacterium]
MIKSFKHKGLEIFYTTGSTKGIQAIHAAKLSRILLALDSLTSINDLSSPSYRLHRLKGNMQNLWAVTVQANWRITFEYDENSKNVYIVDYQDYH